MTSNITQGKARQSNMEMLRIVSMLMILGTHADYYDISNHWIRFMIDSINNVGSDCFVLISGWFGIHPHKRGLLNFLYIIFFYLCLSYFCQVLAGEQTFTAMSLLKSIFRNPGWFVLAYLGLYVLAPVLNSFVDSTSKKICTYFIVAWFIYTFIFGWLVDYIHLERGYTCFSFILLYVIARYANKYKPRWSDMSPRCYLLSFFIFCFLTTVLLTVSEKLGHYGGGDYYFRAYNSPLVIISAISLLIFFSKLRIQNNIINFFARSAFAVYMIHSSMFLYDKYRGLCTSLFTNYSDVAAIALTILLVVLVYALSVLIDQTRQFSWRLIERGIH